MRFYSACFCFMEPYKVLYDSTFIHHLLVHGLTPTNNSLSNLLDARVLFSTRCVIQEHKSLRESHAEAFNVAQQLMTAICNHEKRVDVETCIQSIIADPNSEHFFLASLDFEIRKEFREGPNPLSCKKKKQKLDTSVVKNQDGVAGTTGKWKRIKKKGRELTRMRVNLSSLKVMYHGPQSTFM